MVLPMGEKSYDGATNVVKHEGTACEAADQENSLILRSQLKDWDVQNQENTELELEGKADGEELEG